MSLVASTPTLTGSASGSGNSACKAYFKPADYVTSQASMYGTLNFSTRFSNPSRYSSATNAMSGFSIRFYGCKHMFASKKGRISPR
jgi:hypothetical protein